MAGVIQKDMAGWILLCIKLGIFIYEVVILVFAMLGLLGVVAHEDEHSPNTIKIMILIHLIINAVLIAIAVCIPLFIGKKMYVTHDVFHFVKSVIIGIILTILTWVWDDRNASPPTIFLDLQAYIEWKLILLAIVLGILMIWLYLVDGWYYMFMPMPGESTGGTKRKISSKSKNMISLNVRP